MLLFTPDVFFRLVAQYNLAIWPAQIIGLLLGLLAIAFALRPGRGRDRIIAAILAGAWIWTGLVFHIMHFATINWTAWAFGVIFVLQGLLIAAAGLVSGRLRFRADPGPAGWVGLGCAIAAFTLYPLLGLALGRDWTDLRPFVLAPAPLVLFTLGFLLMARARWLFVVPLLWSLVAGVAAWFLPVPEDLLLPVAGLVCIVLAFSRRGRRDQQGG